MTRCTHVTIVAFLALVAGARPVCAQQCEPSQASELSADPRLTDLLAVCRLVHSQPWLQRQLRARYSAAPEVGALVDWCTAGNPGLPCPAAAIARETRRELSAFANTMQRLRTRVAESACSPTQAGRRDAAIARIADEAERERYRGAVACACTEGCDPTEEQLRDSLVVAAIEEGTTPLDHADLIAAASRAAADPRGFTSAATALDNTVAPAASVYDVILRGLALFLQQRAEAELQSFVVNRVRDLICADPPDPAPTLATAATAAAWLSPRLLVDTCRYLGTTRLSLSASFGDSFVAAVLSDVTLLPSRLAAALAAADAHVRLGIPAGIDLSPAIVTLNLVEVIQRSSSMTDFAARIERLAAELPQGARAGVAATVLARVSAQVQATGGLPSRTTVEALVLDVLRAPTLTAQQSLVLGDLIEATLSGVAALRDAAAATGADQAVSRRQNIHRFVAAALRAMLLSMTLAGESEENIQRLQVAADAVSSWTQSITGEASIAVGVAAALRFVSELISSISAGSQLQLPTEVVRVASLAADLANATTAEEASRVLDSFAAPVGSWRGKSERVVLSLNGFVGLAAGGEYSLSGVDVPASSGWYFAPTALVGLDLAFPLHRGGHLGFIVPVLDVGALLVLGGGEGTPDGATDVRSDVEPLQFVTPGVVFRYGFPEVPIIAGVGFVVAPRGRIRRWTATAADGTTSEQSEVVPSVRILFTLAVDVTILPF